MTIQPIGPTTFLLYLTLGELEERGMHPEFLTFDHTLELAREGLSSLARHTRDTVELESISDSHGLLLFIRTASPIRSVWRFMDCDAFLDAFRAIRNALPSPIYLWKDDFWLVTEHDIDPRLSEYADLMESDPLLSARLLEYAAPLFLDT